MFAGCSALTELDVSSFDFSKAEMTDETFAGCSNLSSIGCSISLPEGCTSENMYAGTCLT